MAVISYEKFNSLLEFLPVNSELEFFFEETAVGYMLIKYETDISFCRCGQYTGSAPMFYKNFSELYYSVTIDNICLRNIWESIDLIIVNNSFNIPNELIYIYEAYNIPTYNID